MDLIFSRNSSVNFYMFHGGTNWGFMNGANVLDRLPYYAPDVTSYGKQLHTMADITYISIICNFRRSAKSISLIFSRLWCSTNRKWRLHRKILLYCYQDTRIWSDFILSRSSRSTRNSSSDKIRRRTNHGTNGLRGYT